MLSIHISKSDGNFQATITNTGTCTPNFWAWHPIGRGIGTGIITAIFAESFRSGFIFGGISGLTNSAFRPLYKKIDEKITSPGAKYVNYIFSSTIPWAVSAGIMHQVYKATGNALFRMHPAAALGTAALVEFFGYANRDLLEDKKSNTDATAHKV